MATLLAIGFGAEVLLIATSVQGVLDNEGKVLKKIDTFDDKIIALATKEKSSTGLGGMISKLTFARLATNVGIKVIIFSVKENNAIRNAIKEKIGTVCVAKNVSKSAKQKWLASGSLVIGSITVDAGAHKALIQRKSLLAVGVKTINGAFEKGEVIEITDENNHVFAIARTKISSKELSNNLKQQKLLLAHADDIVLL